LPPLLQFLFIAARNNILYDSPKKYNGCHSDEYAYQLTNYSSDVFEEFCNTHWTPKKFLSTAIMPLTENIIKSPTNPQII